MQARELEAALHGRYVAIYRWVGVIETIGVSAGLLLLEVSPHNPRGIDWQVG
jgi:hypothetical protein